MYAVRRCEVGDSSKQLVEIPRFPLLKNVLSHWTLNTEQIIWKVVPTGRELHDLYDDIPLVSLRALLYKIELKLEKKIFHSELPKNLGTHAVNFNWIYN